MHAFSMLTLQRVHAVELLQVSVQRGAGCIWLGRWPTP